MRHLVLSLLLFAGAATVAAQTPAPPPANAAVPDAGTALDAWDAFRADPLHRLDRTQPFLDFVSGSGAVHIVLNETLLAWMYEPLEPELKAVLYAAFLGANMAAQIASGEAGSNNVAAMAGALDAYFAIRAARPEFSLPLFETLATARAEDRFAAAVTELAGSE